MLTELVVEDLGVIERCELTLGRGCTALTGETGAGKTLVVAAVGLLLGGRAERTLVRAEARTARVEGRFLVASDGPAIEILRDQGVVEADATSDNGTEIVVTRSVSGDGRTSARVNGRLVTVAALSEIGATLVEVAGQHEHARIGSTSVQRPLLDAYAGAKATELARTVMEAVRSSARAERALAALREGGSARGEEIGSLEAEIAEIENAAVVPGEADELRAAVARLEHAEEIAEGIGRVREALRAEAGALELLDEAARELTRLIPRDPDLEPLGQRLRSAAVEIEDVVQELSERIPSLDPGALEVVRERTALLARLRRRFGVDGDPSAHLQEARDRLAALREASSESGTWERRRDEELARAEGAATKLADHRRRAAARLGREAERMLSALALEGARFEVGLEPRALYEGGTESVEFTIAANEGEQPRPIGKVASGGELARVTLALRLLTASSAAETMIFDEVDAGVGGEAAHAVGRCLAELAEASGGQVLVVTHLPQVAAFADHHVRVTKQTSGGRTRASVTTVEGEERVAELSRMLAGLPSSEQGRGHAQELLELATSRGTR